jgi:hypothetical protein
MDVLDFDWFCSKEELPWNDLTYVLLRLYFLFT